MSTITNRIAHLRAEMKKENIDCVIIPSEDFHQSEYVDDYFKLREYLSGFDGSAGTLIVTMSWAGLWTDGRYFIQAKEQLDGTEIVLMKDGEPDVPKIFDFLKNELKSGDVLGYDGRTISYEFGKNLRETLFQNNINFVNDFDPSVIWEDRPAFPGKPLWILNGNYTGKSSGKKLEEIREAIKEANSEALLISSLADIAWLYNYRGDDIMYTPVGMAYTLITEETAILYLTEGALNEKTKEYFDSIGVSIRPYFQIYEDIKKLDKTVMMDEKGVNETLALSALKPIFSTNPTIMKKAVKNPIEIGNERIAHLKDGIALTKMIFDIKKMVGDGTIQSETELSISEKLYALRKKQPGFISLSFGSIVATAEHGAIVHYEPTTETDLHIENGFLLIDSGGQYYNGTTDVTRTISIGKLSDEMKQVYTAVLKGHLNLGSAVFKRGTRCGELDSLARKPLQDLGLDYKHGTGHGVGYLLSVHEGPNSIRNSGAGCEMQEGMITSNEPGVYLEGKFGIRIENLVLTVRSQSRGDDYLEFETLTLAPYDRDAVNPEMLSSEEKYVFNQYQKHVYESLKQYLTKEEAEWLYWETTGI